MSGFTRLAHSLGEHRQLPPAFGRLNRRTLVSPMAIVAVATISIGLVIGTGLVSDDVEFLASLYSFGVLLAFAAAQLAVIRLRFTEPDLPRPFRAPLLAPLLGAPLAIAFWLVAMVTHPAARYAGPIWLALGLVLYLAVRRRAHIGLLAEVDAGRGAAGGRRVPARARADEARADRGGDGGDGGRAGEGARRPGRRALRDRRPARRGARRAAPRRSRSRRPRRSRRPSCSARRTAFASSRSPSARARSAARSWSRPPIAAPT